MNRSGRKSKNVNASLTGLASYSLLADAVFSAQALAAHPLTAAGSELQRIRCLTG